MAETKSALREFGERLVGRLHRREEGMKHTASMANKWAIQASTDRATARFESLAEDIESDAKALQAMAADIVKAFEAVEAQ